MDFVADVRDCDDAREIFASGISRIAKIGRGTVRLTFYSEHGVGEDLDRRTVVHVVLDLHAFADSNLLAAEALRVIKTEPMDGGDGGGRRRGHDN